MGARPGTGADGGTGARADAVAGAPTDQPPGVPVTAAPDDPERDPARSAWLSAAAKSPQLGYRSSGFLASPRPITSSTAAERSGRHGVTGGGGLDICAHSTASGSPYLNGSDAVRMVNATQASAYWSVS